MKSLTVKTKSTLTSGHTHTLDSNPGLLGEVLFLTPSTTLTQHPDSRQLQCHTQRCGGRSSGGRV